ncbi:hypothetical protein ACE1ET_14015 [Saccharicrinis sp. FJH62]|uniref:hypothetical protein n=1 Tax=Saccharicrinis sp. FJH62 TaxID=3344657 RepID=UPI0035D408E6
MMKLIRVTLIIVLSIVVAACKTDKRSNQIMNVPVPLVVYKTKADYSKYVPVLLNDSKDRIISYPAPGDLTFDGDPALPTQLKNGYLLDNMGIGPNTAFTTYTYEEYSAFDHAPSTQELLNHIIDSDPFSELWLCGTRNNFNTTQDINELILKGFKHSKNLLKE